jgi:putative transposase
MVTPAARREAVRHLREEHEASERRACRVLQVDRSTQRYVRSNGDDTVLMARLKALAEAKPRYGYRRLWVLLRRQGVRVNRKRVQRLYRQLGLSVRRTKRRRMAAQRRRVTTAPTRANERWSMDFVSDRSANGNALRVFAVVDDFTRENVALEASPTFPAERVVAVLERLRFARGLPDALLSDNGTEFTSEALDQWAWSRGVELRFTRPGKPVDNAFIESFNGKLRGECLNRSWFASVEDARRTLAAWRREYNEDRPHRSLGNRTPAEYAALCSLPLPTDRSGPHTPFPERGA